MLPRTMRLLKRPFSPQRSFPLPKLGTFAILGAGIVACGGQEPAKSPVRSNLAVPRDVIVAVDTSPVPEPNRLVVIGAVRKPNELLKTVESWVHLPIPQGPQIAELIAGESLGDILDLDQQLDVGGAIEGSGAKVKPAFAVSLALSSMKKAKAEIEGKGHKLIAKENGAFEIGGLGGPISDEGELPERTCMLYPSAAPTDGRLVCGQRSGVETLGPWLSRTVTRTKTSRDVHLEVRASGARDELKMARFLMPQLVGGLMGGGGSAALRDLVQNAVTDAADFVGDLDKVVIDATANEKGLQVDFGEAFSSTISTMAKLTLSHPERADKAPAAFWHLPEDTDTALYGRGVDGKLMEHPRDLVAAVITEGLQDAGFPTESARGMSRLFSESLKLFETPSLYAKGFDQPAVEKAHAAYKTADAGSDRSLRDLKVRELFAQALGWHLFRFESPSAQVSQIAKDWVALANSKELTKFLNDKMKEKGKNAKLPTLKVGASPASLPKGTVHLELSIPIPADEDREIAPVSVVPSGRGGKPAPAPKPVVKAPAKALPPVVVHFYVVPDAGSSWIAFGLANDVIVKKTGEALSTSKTDKTLKTRTGLEVLQNEKTQSAVMMTLRGMLIFGVKKKDPRDLFGGLSDSGRQPMLLTSSQAVDTGKGGGTTTVSLRISRASIEDLVKVAMKNL